MHRQMDGDLRWLLFMIGTVPSAHKTLNGAHGFRPAQGQTGRKCRLRKVRCLRGSHCYGVTVLRHITRLSVNRFSTR